MWSYLYYYKYSRSTDFRNHGIDIVTRILDYINITYTYTVEYFTLKILLTIRLPSVSSTYYISVISSTHTQSTLYPPPPPIISHCQFSQFGFLLFCSHIVVMFVDVFSFSPSWNGNHQLLCMYS